MAKLGINTGTNANDGTGDTLREAGGKINTNFDEVYSTIGDGTNLFTGIVTSITAGNFISISTSFGDVTITGLANTENINAESLIVTGISTLGMITSVNTMGIGTIFSPRIEVTGPVIANTLVGDGSQITGLATTEFVTADTLVVIGISTLGIVTGTDSVQATDFYGNFHGDGSKVTNIQYSEVAGIATFATSAGVVTFATNAGLSTNATNAVHATTAGVSSYTSSWVVGEDPSNNSHYRFTGPGISTDEDDPELYLVRGGVYRFTNQMGRHPIQFQTDPNGSIGSASTYTDGITNPSTVNGDTIWDVQMDAPNQLYYQCKTHGTMGGSIRILNNDSDFAGYADVAGIATYATNAGLSTNATFATTSGVSTTSGYADVAGIATNATFAGFATTAGISTVSGYADVAGIATFATNAGVATFAPTSGVSTTSGYADVAGIATFATNAGLSTNATFAGYATNAGLSTNATLAGYATNAGLSTNATFAGFATTAGIATVAVNAQGLTGSPSIDINHLEANDILVTGISTLGVVTGATYYGDGTNLTGIVLNNSVQTFNNLAVTGVSTLGVVTGTQSISATNIYATDIVATNVSGDGSGLTGVIASGSVGLKLDDVYVGAGFTSIDFRYEGEQVSSFTGVGNTAVFNTKILASTADTRSNTLVVTGVSTLGVITGTTSIEVNEIYGDNFTGNSGSSDQVKTQSQSLDVDYNVTFVEGNNGSPTNENVFTKANLTYNAFSNILSAPNVSASSSVTAVNFYGDGSGITGVTAAGTGINISDSDSVIGVAGTINFGTNLSVSPVSAGVVTVTASGGGSGITTANILADSLVVSGVSTLASVTVTSITGDGSGLTGIGTFSRNYNDLSNKPTIPTNNNELTNGAGFITATGNGSGLVDGRWTLGANGSNDYTFTGIGFTQTTNDPDLYLARGNVYEFVNGMGAHGFQIQDTQNGTIGNPYNNGVTNNGTNNGTVKFEVPFNSPDTLYYQCVSHVAMGGTIFIYPTLR